MIKADIPHSHVENSDKENILLYYVQNFKNQLRNRYPQKIMPLLTAVNEHGVEKMVCTTIRPTKLKYSELFTWKNCAAFIADFVLYKPLSKATYLPTELRSPQFVIEHQEGSSFEISTLLVSLIAGLGHECYVVSGYATKDIFNNDQTMTSCPLRIAKELEEILEDRIYNSKVIEKFKKKIDISSGEKEFWNLYDEKTEKYRQEEEIMRIEENICSMKSKAMNTEAMFIHSWVLLILDGKNPFFIEPSTGICHRINCKHYIRIESIWNHTNYWVNIKSELPIEALSFDVTDLYYWQHLLFAEPWEKYSAMQVEMNETDILELLKHLDMPVSWVPKLQIQNDNYVERYPFGYKKILYSKCKLEFFSPNHPVTSRSTFYEDDGYKNANIIIEIFSGKSSKLLMQKYNYSNQKMIKLFDHGRNDGLKKFVCCKDTKPIWSNMIMEFYKGARNDNLYLLKTTNFATEAYFEHRQDEMVYFRMEFDESKQPENFDSVIYNLTRIKQKFNQPVNRISTPKRRSIAMKEMDGHRINITYHFEGEEIAPKVSIFDRSKKQKWIPFDDIMDPEKINCDNEKRLFDVFIEEQKVLHDMHLTLTKLSLLIQEISDK